MKMKKLVGLVLGGMMMAGSTMGALADTPVPTASWSVGSYPGTASSGSKYMLDNTGGSSAPISCTSYSSSNSTTVTFSSSNFYSAVGIAGRGTVYGSKKTAGIGNTYYVSYYADGSGRTVANGKIIG